MLRLRYPAQAEGPAPRDAAGGMGMPAVDQSERAEEVNRIAGGGLEAGSLDFALYIFLC